MRHRISPATALSALALFFSLTGAGFAASRYLITSKQQIAPWVRAELHGARGPRGLTGAQGPQGTVSFSKVVRLASAPVPLTPDVPFSDNGLSCPAGYDVLTGGYSGYGEIVTQSFAKEPNEWEVTANLQPGRETGSVTIRVECAPAAS